MSGFFIHHTSIIDDSVQIGLGTKIWQFSSVLKDSFIGKYCVLGQNVSVGPNVKIGDRVKIQNNVSVYEGVELEDDVFCGPSCVFTNVKNPRSSVDRKSEFKSTKVRKGATIGANSTILCGVELGAHCLVGAGALVLSDVPSNCVVFGVPARFHGWVCDCGESLVVDLHCKRCSAKYKQLGKRILQRSE